MKKISVIIAVLAIVTCTCLVVMPFTTAMAMELNGDEYDQVFIETINELGAENYVGDLAISAEKELVYDLHLNTLGYLYDFCINGENGYAIVINANGIIETNEIFFDAENPYESAEEGDKRIYVQTFIYLIYSDNAYYSTEGELVSEETLLSLEDRAYFALSDLVLVTETINYVSKSEDKYELAKRHPSLTATGDTNSTCGTIAGANIIQYWDRYQTNLIPNYTPGATIGTNYLYHTSGTALTAVVDQLYYDMGGDYGVTIDEFINGIGAYCSRQGYTSTFGLLAVNHNFNYSTIKLALKQNLPIAIFLDTFNVVGINTSGNTDSLNIYKGSIPHIMIGFGYRDITYTLSGGTRSDYYLAVASGVAQQARGYMNISQNVQIDAAYSVNII